MNTNCILVPVLCAMWGCPQPTEMPVTHEVAPEEKPQGELPQAPAPHAKKTPAELLVGDWGGVTFLGKPLGPGASVVNQFTKDGKFIFTIINPKTGKELNTGVYRVMGNTIRLTSAPVPDYPSQTWEVTIESISETELTLAAGPPTELHRSTYKRIEKKK